MRSPHSPFCSTSSSSCSLAATSLNNRLSTLFKKAQELTTLCDIEACVIHYGPNGELNTWPKERDKVRDLARQYIQLEKAKRHKKSVDLYGFLNKQKKKVKRNVEELKYLIYDHYSPHQINQLIQSLTLSYSILQERRHFFESQKQAKTNLEDHHQQYQYLQIQFLNPSQFTKYPEDYSVLVQESGLQNHLLTQKEFYGGYDQNICLGNINIFTHPCVSNTQDCSALPSELQASVNNYRLNQLMQMGNINNVAHPCVINTHDCSALPSELQGSANNYGFNQLMQHELYGFDQNMCTSDTTNSNILGPCLSNRVSDGLSFEFPPSFSQDFPSMFSSFVLNFDENRLLQPSALPSLQLHHS